MKKVMRKASARLDVGKILAEFQRDENGSTHHKGTFKIGAPFEEALGAILKVKPEKKSASRKPHTR